MLKPGKAIPKANSFLMIWPLTPTAVSLMPRVNRTIPPRERFAAVFSGGTVWEDATLPPQCYRADKLAVSPSGALYLTGWRVLDDGTTPAARVWASSDQGGNWVEVATFLTRSASDVAVDAAENVFLCTTRQVGTTPKYVVTRLVSYKGHPDPAAPLGMSWTLVDDYSATGQYAYAPNTLTIRPSADPSQPAEIWVAGYFVDSKTLGSYFPFVRRSLDGGATWTTVSTWTAPSGYSFISGSWGVVATADANGIAYATASYAKKVGKTTQRYWLTYRSLNHGATWTLKDILSVASGTYGPSGITADALGGVFITGGGVTRASVDGGATWANAEITGASYGAADLVGNVFVGGYTTEGVIYKLPAPLPAP